MLWCQQEFGNYLMCHPVYTVRTTCDMCARSEEGYGNVPLSLLSLSLPNKDDFLRSGVKSPWERERTRGHLPLVFNGKTVWFLLIYPWNVKRSCCCWSSPFNILDIVELHGRRITYNRLRSPPARLESVMWLSAELDLNSATNGWGNVIHYEGFERE